MAWNRVWTKAKVREAVALGADPSKLGKLAHRILDVAVDNAGNTYCRTPAHGWHPMTDREDRLLNPQPANQQATRAEQLVLI